MATAHGLQGAQRDNQVAAAPGAVPACAARTDRTAQGGLCHPGGAMAARAAARMGREPAGRPTLAGRGLLSPRAYTGTVVRTPARQARPHAQPVDSAEVSGVA